MSGAGSRPCARWTRCRVHPTRTRNLKPSVDRALVACVGSSGPTTVCAAERRNQNHTAAASHDREQLLDQEERRAGHPARGGKSSTVVSAIFAPCATPALADRIPAGRRRSATVPARCGTIWCRPIGPGSSRRGRPVLRISSQPLRLLLRRCCSKPELGAGFREWRAPPRGPSGGQTPVTDGVLLRVVHVGLPCLWLGPPGCRSGIGRARSAQ